MKPRSAKAKGRNFVAEVCETVCQGLQIPTTDLRVTPSGVNGEDILLSARAIQAFPFAVECKNTMTLNIWSAIRQALSHAMGTRRYPLVVFRRNHSETYACLHLNDLIALLQKIQAMGGSFEGFEVPLDEPAGK